ncbi:MAG: hypothetical protein HFH62_11675 [Lachnospiraceae bacterium]|nr:hypothetical protein [Lachnospiraceae bacterium]
MKRRKLFIGLIICAMVLYQHALCSAYTIKSSAASGIEKEELPYETCMKKYKEWVSKASDWKSSDGSYHYPVTDHDKEWDEMDTWEEKYTACQIPEEIMKKLDTDKLLKLVLEFPMLDEIMFTDSYFEWITKFCAPHFNGMHELINRPDFYETVLAYYEKLKIPLHRKVHLEKFLPKNPTTEDYLSIPESESEKSRKDLHFANTVNFCMTVVGGMTDGVDKNMLKKAKKVFATKLLEIEVSEHRNNILTREDVQNADWMDQAVTGIDKVTVYAQSRAAGPKTRSGGSVRYTPAKNPQKVSDSKKDWVLDHFKGWDLSTGKQVVRILGGTTGYNCHNYAWLYFDDKYKDKYWKKGTIESVADSYMNDGAYGSSDKATSSYQIGSNGNVHSVVVVKNKITYRTSTGEVKTDVLVKSKWGPSGALVEHPLGLMPSNYLNDAYSYYC